VATLTASLGRVRRSAGAASTASATVTVGGEDVRDQMLEISRPELLEDAVITLIPR
jgi:hypothetical protein